MALGDSDELNPYNKRSGLDSHEYFFGGVGGGGEVGNSVTLKATQKIWGSNAILCRGHSHLSQ